MGKRFYGAARSDRGLRLTATVRDGRVDGERPRLGGGALAADLVEHVGVVAAPEVERQRAARGRGREALEQRGRGVAPRHGLVVEADEDVAGADLGADADDAALVEVGEQVEADVGEVTGDLLLAELRVARVDLVLLDVDRAEHVVLHQVLAQDDRVLEVVTLPRHERHEQVLAERELTVLGRGAIGDDLADLDALALIDDHAVVVAGALVRAVELAQEVLVDPALVGLDSDDVRRVYPRLPATPAERNAMLRALDLDAYRATPSAFPPPGENTSTELSLGRIFNPLLQA